MKYNFLNIVGLMTGTSMDGIDISLVRTNGIDLRRLNKNYFYRYSDKTKSFLVEILNEDINYIIKKKKYLDNFVTKEHYLALKNLDIIKNSDVIGFHGQTIYHNPKNKISIQLGNPTFLAKLLKKDVVFNFRDYDIRLGGQGAPLAPIYHKFIIEKLKFDLPFCVLNIGGISNLTYWDGNQLIGFDTGPGNGLMDMYMSTKFNKNFDKDGSLAAKGNPIKEEIKKFLHNSFFKSIPPKSLDKLSFFAEYKDLIKKQYSTHDIMATLAEFTVETIAIGIELLPKKVKNIMVTGGGYRNIHLMNRIKKRLRINIFSEHQLGINFDYIESELIAYLSARSIYNLPITFPTTTGVSKPSSGGKLYKKL